MQSFFLNLYEDVIEANHLSIYLPAIKRAIYVVQGDLTINFQNGIQHQTKHSAWVGDQDIDLIVGKDGATIWRWELINETDDLDGFIKSAPGTKSELKLSAPIQLDSKQKWLMRCDEVGFPPSGIAYTHVHQGPGVRCTLQGEITIETLGESKNYPAGSAWLELGYAPVLAPTTEREETTFIRCFILPQLCKGKSSIRYVYSEDAAKNKPQKYHVFAERFISID